jgi:8-oxo-dGTP pyrophosphatase MutT (NUDIX family)
MQNFPEKLKAVIRNGLPGTEVQWQMASSGRMLKNFPRLPGNDTRIAAVLVLLYPLNRSIYTVFIQRPDYNGVHGGQISFPGGKQEPGDADIIETALREANEEIGVDISRISVIGTLTPLFIPVSNMLVTPVVGWTKVKPEFRTHTEEVVYAFDAALFRFLDPLILKVNPLQVRGETFKVKYFDYEGKVIWGATAMILNELLAILKNTEFSVTGFKSRS